MAVGKQFAVVTELPVLCSAGKKCRNVCKEGELRELDE